MSWPFGAKRQLYYTPGLLVLNTITVLIDHTITILVLHTTPLAYSAWADSLKYVVPPPPFPLTGG